MLTIIVPLIATSLLGGFMFLIGASSWYKKDMPRAVLYSAGGFFLVMATTIFVTANTVAVMVETRLQQAGLVEQAAPTYEIPPYRQ